MDEPASSSEAVTRGVRVEVESRYDPERSAPHEDYYFFAYHVRISNVGEGRVQLQRRRWVITDGDGSVQEVEGDGVVGNQPVLEPGQSFEYTSFCPLRTALGWMEGTYTMLAPEGERFEARVERFALEAPHAVN